MTQMVSKDYQYLDKRHLRIFFYTHKFGGFGRAKNKLGMEKSAIIEAMNELESVLGKLFVRDNKRGYREPSKLTDLGNILFSRMEKENIIEEWEKDVIDPFIINLKNEINVYYENLEKEKKITFTISQDAEFFYHLDVLSDFRKNYSEIIIKIVHPFENVINLVVNKGVDFCITSSYVMDKPFEYKSNKLVKEFCDIIPIYESPWVIYANYEKAKKDEKILEFFTEANKGKLSKKEIYEKIAQYPVFSGMYENYGLELLENRFRELGIKNPINFLNERIENLTKNYSFFLFIKSRKFLYEEYNPQFDECVTLELDLPKDVFGIVYIKDKWFLRGMKIFIDFLLIQEGREPYFSKISTKN